MGEWEGGWVQSEMEGLEERGGGLPMSGERELFWWGGGEAHRRKREREWENDGWEEWEVIGGGTGKLGGQTDTLGSSNDFGTRKLVPNAFPTSQLVGNARHLGFDMEESEGAGGGNGGECSNGGDVGDGGRGAPIMEEQNGVHGVDGVHGVNRNGVGSNKGVDGVHGVNGNGVGSNNGAWEMENSDGVGSINGGTCGNGVGSNNNGGNGGTVGNNMDGGGDVRELEVNPRCREEPLPNRKTLRGKRRGGKKNISVEERERLACAMQRWLGKQNLGPESHH